MDLTDAQWAALDDPRVTRVGKILRKTHFDELPQMVNILRGQRSFVGPRPERPEFVGLLNESIRFISCGTRFAGDHRLGASELSVLLKPGRCAPETAV